MKNANKPNRSTRASSTWDGIPWARAKVTGKGKVTSWGKSKTGGTQSVNEASKGRLQTTLGKGQGSTHQFVEASYERHVHFEDDSQI